MLFAAGDPPARNIDPEVGSAIAEMIDMHCLDCHAGKRAKGGVNLDGMENRTGILSASPSLLAAVRDRLRAEDMPPIDVDLTPAEAAEIRPTSLEYERAIDDLGAVLKSRVATEGVPAVVVRRLNRVEYRNAVQDLLDVDVDVSGLPADEVGQAFDHLGEVLAVSPLLLEKMVDLAERVARQAIVDPDQLLPDVRALNPDTYRGKQRSSRQGVWRNNSGEVFAEVELPRAGRYRAEFDLAGKQAGPDPVRFALRLDHEEQFRVDVPETPDAPSTHAFEFEADAGMVRLGAAFLNDYYRKSAPLPKDRDRNALIAEIRLIGPLDPADPSRIQLGLEASVRKGGERVGLARAARRFLEQAWRRRVESDEALAVADLVREACGEDASVSAQLQGLVVYALISPRFLYRFEEPKSGVLPDEDGSVPLDDHSIASRLAAFLFCSIPDEELLRAARSGRLQNDRDLVRQVRRMLEDPRSRIFSNRFASQWLRIDGVEGLEPDPLLFGEIGEELLADMRNETEESFHVLMQENRPVWDLFQGDETFLTERLARHYDLKVDGSWEGTRRINLAELGAPQAGLGVLAHASVLSSTSNPTRTSPVKRGKWIMEALLDTPPPPPPPGTPQLPSREEAADDESIRMMLERHRADPDCAVCHVRMDAYGLALERLSPVGRWRTMDQEKTIDALTILPDGRIIDGPQGVREVLVGNRAVLRSLASHMLVFALGRGLEWRDEPLLDDLVRKLEVDPTISSLVENIVLSPQFRRMPSDEPEKLDP